MSTREVVICAPVRTPVGRYGGMLAALTAAELGAVALQGLLYRTGIEPALIEDVILGNCYPSSEAPALGRVVALDAGLPVTTAGMQVDRRCGSGLQSVIQAVLQVGSGANEILVAGGVESMSNVVFYSTDIRWGGARTGVRMHDGLVRGRETAGGKHHPVPGGMVETAENLRRSHGITRAAQDRLALRSHRNAVAAIDSGAAAEQIVPTPVPGRRNTTIVCDTDEHPRADTTLEALAALVPLRAAVDPESTVTAGNSSGMNDAAAMCLVTTRERAEQLGVPPSVRLVSWAVAGVPPELMGIGPVPATTAALDRAGLTLADMDLIEVNEAFAAQALAVLQEWGFGDDDLERVNVHGSGISLGHPVGATGTRMLATLARELHRREQRYGLETICLGGGQGLSAVFERVA
ncbi:acetyl-CoA C-acetyltransferase [Skermania piniformis]|uniref:acetyl-CoA C-acetyltransferase n=1 Tax=Skermania pinensis TaxID=39122 RepID=UPI000ACA3869|nr:acetyl-CoA C-acetyltransferase [Skermania piniformis]